MRTTLNSYRVFHQLLKTEEYSERNSMQINKKKTKVMVFNPCKAWDFQPALSLDNQELDMVEEMRLLGVVIQSDLKWTSNTEQMVVKG